MLAERLSRRPFFALIARADAVLLRRLSGRRDHALGRLMIFATRSGNAATYAFVGLIGLLAGGGVGHVSLTVALAGASASALGYCVKRLVARQRPSAARTVQEALLPNPDAWSFPSAHTAAAFAAATALANSVGMLAGLPAILWAISVAWSRLYVGAHYPLDVFCGLMLGVAVGNAVGG